VVAEAGTIEERVRLLEESQPRYIEWRTQTTVTISSANQGSTTITFPAGTFGTAPNCAGSTIDGSGTNPTASRASLVAFDDVTSSGCTVFVTHRDTSALSYVATVSLLFWQDRLEN
jgi:hypothetical protein